MVAAQVLGVSAAPAIRDDCPGPFILRHRIGRTSRQTLGSKKRFNDVFHRQAAGGGGVELRILGPETIQLGLRRASGGKTIRIAVDTPK
jgi:hypothetical protein